VPRAAELVTGGLVGYVASRAMDAATGRFHARQSEASREREREISAGGALVDLGRLLGRAAGRDLDDDRAARAGLATHRTLGVTYGVLAAVLVRRGVPPLAAGPLVGAAAWVVVDEGSSLPTLTRYPAESHVRGVVGHGTWGLVAGVLLTLTSRRSTA
jgi:hypothetical protein